MLTEHFIIFFNATSFETWAPKHADSNIICSTLEMRLKRYLSMSNYFLWYLPHARYINIFGAYTIKPDMTKCFITALIALCCSRVEGSTRANRSQTDNNRKSQWSTRESPKITPHPIHFASTYWHPLPIPKGIMSRKSRSPGEVFHLDGSRSWCASRCRSDIFFFHR